MKIGFVSSSGGHWEELLCLKELAAEHDSFYVTEKGEQSDHCGIRALYTVPQINRQERGFLFHFLRLFFTAWRILKTEKPDVLITTGALASYPFCLLGHWRGAKIVYIESFARIHNASLTGHLVYRFADLFLVQWKPMLEVYPKAEYIGCIF